MVHRRGYNDSIGDKIATGTVYGAVGIGVGALGAAIVVGGTILGTATGAGIGEVIDHVPYLSRAIPDGISLTASYFNSEAAQASKDYLDGNLDKLGASLGFVGTFIYSIKRIIDHV